MYFISSILLASANRRKLAQGYKNLNFKVNLWLHETRISSNCPPVTRVAATPFARAALQYLWNWRLVTSQQSQRGGAFFPHAYVPSRTSCSIYKEMPTAANHSPPNLHNLHISQHLFFHGWQWYHLTTRDTVEKYHWWLHRLVKICNAIRSFILTEAYVQV